MSNRWKPYMTEDMLDVLADLDIEYMKQEFLFCHENYLKALKASEVKLGAKASSGEKVRHGAKMEIVEISNYWLKRRDLIKEYLPREWVEEKGVNSWLFIK